MPSKDRFSQGIVTDKICWNDHLFTLKVKANIQPFVAGQFTSLAADINQEHVARAYSIASAAQADELEFYFNRVTDGPLSNYLADLNIGDPIEVARRAAGYFTLEEIVGGEQIWMLSTGTGLGPTISILREKEVWQRFEKIIVVHAARTAADLGYRNELEQLAAQHHQLVYIPVATREKMQTSLSQRFPVLIQNQTLQAEAGTEFSTEKSRVMLCGNMQMIKDTIEALGELGLTKHRRSKHGQIITEKYW